jgi:hypothetical protein
VLDLAQGYVTSAQSLWSVGCQDPSQGRDSGGIEDLLPELC